MDWSRGYVAWGRILPPVCVPRMIVCSEHRDTIAAVRFGAPPKEHTQSQPHLHIPRYAFTCSLIADSRLAHPLPPCPHPSPYRCHGPAGSHVFSPVPESALVNSTHSHPLERAYRKSVWRVSDTKFWATGPVFSGFGVCVRTLSRHTHT